MNLCQNLNFLFVKIEKLILIFIWNFKRASITKTTLKIKNKVGEIIFYEFKTYSKALLVIIKKTMCHWSEDRHIHQGTRIGSPEINPYIYVQLMFYEDAKTIQRGKRNLFTVNANILKLWGWLNNSVPSLKTIELYT